MISSPKSAREILDLYFLENRARILDIASFLDRIDRYKESEEAKADFRYKAFIKTLKLLVDTHGQARGTCCYRPCLRPSGKGEHSPTDKPAELC